MHTRYAPVRHSQSPEGDLTVRLACIRPAASVHPEPGSNSSLYYCLSCLFFSESRVPPPGASLRRSVPYLGSFFGIRLDACAGLRLSKNLRLPSPPFWPLSLGKRVQKYNLFRSRQWVFSSIFDDLHKSLVYRWKKFPSCMKTRGIRHLINMIGTKSRAKMRPRYGLYPCRLWR